MKVLEIISTYEPTGVAETFAVNFSREFQQISEFKVFVLYQKHKSYFEEKIREANVVLVFLDKTKRFDCRCSSIGNRPNIAEEEAKKYSFITYFGKTFHISGIESYERLQQYDLHMFPSHFFQECAPGSILDMFIAGVPTLSSLFPNALNVMNERNSYFFEFKNFDDLVAKLDYVYAHKEELNAKSQRIN